MALLHGDTFPYDNTAQPLKNGTAVGTAVTYASANGYFSGDPCLDVNGLTRLQILSSAGKHYNIAAGNTYYLHFCNCIIKRLELFTNRIFPSQKIHC